MANCPLYRETIVLRLCFQGCVLSFPQVHVCLLANLSRDWVASTSYQSDCKHELADGINTSLKTKSQNNGFEIQWTVCHLDGKKSSNEMEIWLTILYPNINDYLSFSPRLFWKSIIITFKNASNSNKHKIDHWLSIVVGNIDKVTSMKNFLVCSLSWFFMNFYETSKKTELMQQTFVLKYFLGKIPLYYFVFFEKLTKGFQMMTIRRNLGKNSWFYVSLKVGVLHTKKTLC